MLLEINNDTTGWSQERIRRAIETLKDMNRWMRWEMEQSIQEDRDIALGHYQIFQRTATEAAALSIISLGNAELEVDDSVKQLYFDLAERIRVDTVNITNEVQEVANNYYRGVHPEVPQEYKFLFAEFTHEGE
jgi:hypothetical protein